MASIAVDSLTVYYDPEEQQAGEMIHKSCELSVKTIQASWNLSTPEDCRVYVLSSWPRCVFQGAPLGAKILLGITLPVWYSEFKKRWLYSGGWSQTYGRRHVVGIKSPRLIAVAPESIGGEIFNKLEHIEDKVTSIVSHELTHAFSSHLRLPTWLNEGLAMLTSDRCLEKQTVRMDTLNLLKDSNQGQLDSDRIDLRTQSRTEIVLLYVRGYWMTRNLAETAPDLLTSILEARISPEDVELRVIEEFELTPGNFWQSIDNHLFSHYEHKLAGMVTSC